MNTVDRGYGHNEEQIFLKKNLPKAQGLNIWTNIDKICHLSSVEIKLIFPLLANKIGRNLFKY